MQNSTNNHTTIAAAATGPGGAIALIRLSGPQAIAIAEKVFSKPLADAPGYTVHFGTIADGERILDEVLVTLFRASKSYTGEDMVEISCHGSSYITREILALLIRHGAVPATAGEFTRRAFLNGKLDLSQAEAVADLIASESGAAHRIALNQMRGGYAAELAGLRAELLHITSLLELELDFSEEDVEFADRSELERLLTTIRNRCRALAGSFRTGNVLKNGVPVAIVGAPNAGKSTLLNRLVGEERAIVSDIAGTTRDFIEESLTLEGIRFRFIDTAGLRHTDDEIEALGIERTKERISRSTLILLLVSEPLPPSEIEERIRSLQLSDDQRLILLFNKSDLWDTALLTEKFASACPVLSIAARTGEGVEALKALLIQSVETDIPDDSLIVSNIRHYEALLHASEALDRAIAGVARGLPADLISEEVRQVLHYLGTITGEITTDDILGNIFSKFCIGK
ncbi:tRNA uridine-5-carboxymethylaminomethyl(34) synthesis GTPase MnmE [uncultured Rikenella sp.]|uniref:tRNA uridine-5-carboxymethylaminomethyl(34) synthesis GTPase MnmE n=1 Tax=uncultured Rikenella sp. TaxID=368003 RepID=UPI00260AC9B8|nr:tRNA uridine-5-carboxymethylaminomethyl(34) synthesis GTPase MnmE [uncultured Rikenella sp.]